MGASVCMCPQKNNNKKQDERQMLNAIAFEERKCNSLSAAVLCSACSYSL